MAKAFLPSPRRLFECGVAYVGGYQGAPISHLMDVLADAQDIMGDFGVHFEFERVGGDRRGDAGSLRPLSDPRRGDLQVAGRRQRRIGRTRQSRLRRRERWRAHHPRRGLWRRLLDHAGAEPRLRDEVPSLAARPAAESRDDREGGARRIRAVGSLQHAGHAGDAHPLVPRARPLQGARQPAPQDEPRGGAGESAARPEPHRAAAGLLSARTGEGHEALAGGGEVHPRARAERAFRPGGRPHRHRLPGRHVQRRDARPAATRPRRHPWPHRPSALRPERHLSADRRGVPRLRARQGCRSRRRGGPAEPPRAGLRRDAAQGRLADEALRQGPLPDRRRIYRRGDARERARLPEDERAGALERPRPQAERAGRARDCRSVEGRSAAPARLLHRLPGASDLRRDEARREGARAPPCRRRHRLPSLLDHAALQYRREHDGLWARARLGLRLQRRSEEAADLGHGRRRLLAQRPERAASATPSTTSTTASRSSSTTSIPPRPAGRTSCRPAPRTARARPAT